MFEVYLLFLFLLGTASALITNGSFSLLAIIFLSIYFLMYSINAPPEFSEDVLTYFSWYENVRYFEDNNVRDFGYNSFLSLLPVNLDIDYFILIIAALQLLLIGIILHLFEKRYWIPKFSIALILPNSLPHKILSPLFI